MTSLSEGRVRPVNPHWLAIVLSSLMAFAPLAIDMYLPALPEIGRGLNATPATVQLSLASFFLGFGSGQLVWGPLGDRFGRRSPIVIGIVIYIAASFGCALTNDADHLVLWRFVQAFGACAAPVLARAMVRDLFPQDQAARMLSLMMLIMGIAPMVAPLIGGQILVLLDWRAIFWGLAAFGLVVLLALFSIPESLPSAQRRRVGIGAMVMGYLRLLGNRSYMAYTLAGAFFTGGMFTYIAATPFVYIEYFGISPQIYGFLFGMNVIGMMAFNIVNRRLVTLIGSDRALLYGSIGCAVFGVALAVLGGTGSFGLLGIVVPLFLYLSMMGLVGANSMAGSMSVIPGMAGAASGLAGTVQFALGALASALVGWLSDGTPAPMALVIGGMGICCALSALALPTRRT
ncbi:Bcr/CflA family multidrug efflux MFS transporter [Skermanella stibiiresistens]|nr:Bcr/CflA family multidrug efflux MFS transporter [Skermanella stibiiresistens]